jgi:hypothetical protein
VISPVLSVQYMIWGLPVLLLVSSGAARARYFLALVITQIEFPTCWGLVSNMTPAGVAIMAARNAVIVAIWLILLRDLIVRSRGLAA